MKHVWNRLAYLSIITIMKTVLYVYADVNECEARACHTHAICTNTRGSYECQCSAGFTGDGMNCSGRNCLHWYTENIDSPLCRLGWMPKWDTCLWLWLRLCEYHRQLFLHMCCGITMEWRVMSRYDHGLCMGHASKYIYTEEEYKKIKYNRTFIVQHRQISCDLMIYVTILCCSYGDRTTVMVCWLWTSRRNDWVLWLFVVYSIT